MNNTIEMNTTEVLKTNFMPYSAHVILDRALPEIDGFKPSQRRVLYTMYKMGLLKGARKKSQTIAGQTMALHPHGDSTIYDTLVRMTKDAESLLVPWIDSKGNFGKHYSRDMQYAHSRYTEAKLMEIAKELFTDINKDTVDLVDNYDGELKEPRFLPVTFPTILTNPQSGTAVGMGTNIPSFNINEVIDFTIAYLTNKKANVKDFIKAPDFPTGANIIYDEEVMDNILNNGRGSVTLRAKYEIDENTITFTEIPYTTTYEAIVDKIVELVKDNKIKDIVDVHDRMGIHGQGLEVTVKKNVNMELLIERLFRMTPLESSYGCNMNLIVDGSPKVLGVKEIVHEWILFRAKTIKRGAEFDLREKDNKRHLLLALNQVLLDIDRAISIIRETKKNSQVVERLMEEFSIDKEQAEYVAEIKLRHLNKEYLMNRISEIETLEREIADLNTLINDKVVLAKLMIKQLREVKDKYGKERKTGIIEIQDIPKEKIETIEIDDYNLKIFVTKEGYLKKIPLTSLRGNFEIRVKDGDEIVDEYELTNTSEILVFTDKRNVYKLRAYEIDNHRPSELGEYLPTLLKLEDEKILYITATKDFKGDLLIGFSDGRVARIEMNAYKTKTNRTVLKNAYADKEAIYFKQIDSDIELLSISSIDKALIIDTSTINSKTSKTTIGVSVLKSKDNSFAKFYGEASKHESTEYYKVKGSTGVGKYLRDGDFKLLT